MGIWEMLLALGLPSAVIGGIVGLFFWKLQRRLDHAAKEQAERDRNRHLFETNQYKLLLALSALAEANAVAIQNGKSNGETHAALEYARQIKQEQRNFLAQQGIEHLY